MVWPRRFRFWCKRNGLSLTKTLDSSLNHRHTLRTTDPKNSLISERSSIMPNDPGLAADNCFFMEAISGDGGVHNPNAVWWLSPDISLAGPVSGADKADPGLVNPVHVKFHRQAGACITPGDESISVQLWVGNPSLVMAPNDPVSTTLVGFTGAQLPAPGGNTIQQIDWTPPSGLPPDNPQSSGHKCLVARCYPESLTPSVKSFFVPDDPHVAQHNICIVPCG